MNKTASAGAFLLLLAAMVRAEEPPVPISHWREVVRAYDKSVRTGDSDTRRAAEAGLRAIRSVRLESGDVIRTDTEAILSRLDRLKSPEQRPSRDDRSHAATLRYLAEVSPKRTSSDPAADVRNILSRTEFRDAATGKSESSALEKYFVKQLRRMSEWLSKLFGRMPRDNGKGLESFALTMRLFLYFLGGVLAIVIAWHLVRIARESGWIKSRRKKITPTVDDLIAEEVTDPLADAALAERNGDLRTAVRLYYIATLRQLREGGWIALEANRTNWEYQRQLGRGSRERAALLRPATVTFDRIWYGGRIADETDLATMRHCYAAMSEVKE